MPLVTRGLGAFNTGSASNVVSAAPFTGTAVPTQLKVTAITIPDLKASDVQEIN